MKPDLIALDMDGTLLDGERRVSPRAARAISQLAARGVEVILATGRPPRMTRRYVLDLGLEHALVFNGASRYSASRDHSVHHHELERGQALAVIRRLRAGLPDIGIGMETAHGWYLDETLERRRRQAPGLNARPPDGVGPVEDFVREAVIKIFARHPEHDAQIMGRALDGAGIYMTWTNIELLEVQHPEVNKRDALQRFAAERGITREAVAAFGDEHNDVQMLSWAGHGVAMANGTRDAKEAADEVARSNDEDGVAQVLERWL